MDESKKEKSVIIKLGKEAKESKYILISSVPPTPEPEKSKKREGD